MQDTQSLPANVAMPIDHVGVKKLRLPITVRDRQNGVQHTVATVSIGVDLPAEFKGTHMSRFVEVLENWSEELQYQSMKRLLHTVKEHLQAQRAFVIFEFPYFLRKQAPATSSSGLLGYDCRLTGELASDLDKPSFLLEVNVPTMTVCPCSKAISREGAHSQRADVRITVRMTAFHWLEEFISIAESAASSPVYPLLKREDEKYVTEHAFANPTFVEDVVRTAAHKLSVHPHISWFRVEVESHESIHAHNAYACIERTISQGAV